MPEELKEEESLKKVSFSKKSIKILYKNIAKKFLHKKLRFLRYASKSSGY